jgi:hypothetical protein
MGIAATRAKLLESLNEAGIFALVQERAAPLNQPGIYLVFEAVESEANRPIVYRFSLFIVASELEGENGAFNAIDNLFAAQRTEQREFGKARYMIAEASLSRFDGALSVYKIGIKTY